MDAPSPSLTGRRDPLADPRCLPTVEMVLIDGANGTCHEPRIGAGQPARTLLWGFLATVLIAAAIAVRARAGQKLGGLTWILPVALAIAAVPGYEACLRTRGDRPAAVHATAEALRFTVEQVERFARRHRDCVEVRAESCVGCDPLVRLALGGRPRVTCREHSGVVQLGADAIGARCNDRGARLECGSTLNTVNRSATTSYRPPATR